MAERILGQTDENLILEDELESYSSSIQSKVEGKRTLANRIKFLDGERNKIGRLNINDPDYVYKYHQLEIIDHMRTEIESAIPSSGRGRMTGKAGWDDSRDPNGRTRRRRS